MKRRPLVSCLLSAVLFSIACFASPALGAGLVSLTFDDGLVTTYTDVLPILTSYGLKATAAIPTTGQGESPESMSIAQIRALRDAGWEIASHSMNHVESAALPLTYDKEVVANWTKTTGQTYLFQIANPFGTVGVVVQDGRELTRETSVHDADYREGSFFHETLTNTVYVHPFGNVNPNTVEMRVGSLQRELEYSKKKLEDWGFDVVSFVTPNNEWSTVFADLAKPYYSLVADGLETANDPGNLNPYWLGRISTGTDTPVDELTSFIQAEAINKDRWVIVCMHGLNGNGYEPWTSEKLSSLAAWIKAKGVQVVTLREGLAAVQPEPPVDPLVNTLTPPVNTVARPDDALGPFTSVLTNQTASALACSYDEFYKTPSGQLVKVNSVTGLSLDSNATRTETKSFTVPAGLTPGSYTYLMRLYDKDGKQVDEDSFAFTVVAANTVFHKITSSAGPGGSISPAGLVSVIHGGSQLYTITPDQGYIVAELIIDGESFDARTTYTFSSLSADHTIEARFGRPVETFAITASAGVGGTVTPAGVTNVPAGSDQVYTIKAGAGYTITDVQVDGISVGAKATYTFTDVSTRHSINATFARSTYTITAGTGSGGGISPDGATTVNWGGSQTYTITPATGHVISDVLVDDLSVGPVTTYTFTNVSSNHKISAIFAVQTYKLTASSGPGGTVTPAGVTTIQHGGTQTYTITPSTGYAVDDVLVDGKSVGPRLSYTFAKIASAHSISATFVRSPCTITASSGAGGTISPSGSVTVDYGDSLNFTITPASGQTISDVTVDGVSVGAHSTYTFANITSGHAIVASFAAAASSVTPSTPGTMAGLAVRFTGTTNVSGAATAVWDFGDGTATVEQAASAPASHAYAGVGTFTVKYTLLDASGRTLDTATTVVTITTGRTASSPVQGDQSVTVVLTGESFTDLAAGELRSRYAIADATVQPLRPASAFTATTSKSAAYAAFRFPIHGLALEVAKLRLYKLKPDNTSVAYAYGSSADLDADGMWWITDEAGYDIPFASTLAAGRTYYVNFVIRDNGPFDLDQAPGTIKDPVSFSRSDTAAAPPSSGGSGTDQSPAGNGGSDSGGGGGGGGGGCSSDPAAAPAADLAAIAGLAVAVLVRRRYGAKAR